MIKLKNDSPIESFTEVGMKFANPSYLRTSWSLLLGPLKYLPSSLGDPVSYMHAGCLPRYEFRMSGGGGSRIRGR
ncbi:hypothetical protein GALMADRAFT_1158301 [Galerina marginata CBS 339.88]|uniref:Uncharacterized protein n=1 Tax=Galerina marginata (strain CBS 339.88) TaxID=685588 RepID=A0A067S8W3_GALM3|nr:hypothetical protein GALMADRAFT_1158301 [Galerina marginata CBS 339.88]